MNITIIGGGNLGSALAGELATKGHTVILHTSKASIFRSQIRIVEDRREYDSKSFTATDDLKYALCHRRPGLIIVTVPANGLGVLSERMRNRRSGIYVFTIYPTRNYAFRDAGNTGCLQGYRTGSKSSGFWEKKVRSFYRWNPVRKGGAICGASFRAF